MTEVAGIAAAAEIVGGDQAPHQQVEAAEAHGDCANCGAHLTGPYCAQCGQKGHLHTRVWHMAEDFVEGVLHFDGRLWRTLPLLLFRPGRLSRAWIEGKRVRYVAPLHVFLFGIFLFFLALSLSGGRIYDPCSTPSPSRREALRFRRRRGDRTSVSSMKRSATTSRPAASPSGMCAARWSTSARTPKYYAYKAETTTYKLAPLLAPLSMAILALLLVFKRGYTLYDHGVVALYGLSFVALTTTLSIILNAISPGDWSLFVFLAMIVHAVVHLRGAYRLSWFGAAARTLLLGSMTMTIFGLFLFFVATLSAA
jgi:hypothetical protein